MPSKAYAGHLKSLSHKNLAWKAVTQDVQMCSSAFQKRICSYKVSNRNSSNLVDVSKFLIEMKSRIISLLENEVSRLGQFKVNFEFFGSYILPHKNVTEIKSFNTSNKVVTTSTDLDDLLFDVIEILDKKSSEFILQESGWILQRCLFLEINISKYNPLRASSYIPLPKEIQAKKAVLNIQNKDQFCFGWCVVAAVIAPVGKPNRPGSYPHFSRVFDFSGIEYPVSLKNIVKFEAKNNLSINVYGLDKIFFEGKTKYQIVGPLHYTNKRQDLHINLLLLDDSEGNTHYCLIQNFSRLVSSQVSKAHGAKHFCDGCLQYFNAPEKLVRHQQNDCGHISVVLPTNELKEDRLKRLVPKNILRFENFYKQVKTAFCVFADFECVLKEVTCGEEELPQSDSFTVKKYEHIPCLFSYYIKCDFNPAFSKFEIYAGTDAPEVFVHRLERDLRLIYNNFLKGKKPMKPLSDSELYDFEQATVCYICEEPFSSNDFKVKDHDHCSSKYRGPAHNSCNLNLRMPLFTPIILHNLKNYDAHLFIRSLGRDHASIEVIPSTYEKYISFTKYLLVENVQHKQEKPKQIFLQMRFLDSFQFLPSSLDTLASNLSSEQCKEVRRFYPKDDEFSFMRQKGVFPYSYVNNFDKLKETKLPEKSNFFNELQGEDITDEEYKRAKDVWSLFKCENLEDYYKLYLKSDVLLLADVFENYRELCLRNYKLDPVHYFTSPGLSWDAMLRYTKVELELLTDIDKLHFFSRNIRGGVSVCVGRQAKANNPFIENYDPKKPTSFIVYLDATALYSAAMQKPLPTGNFAWLSSEEIDCFPNQLESLTEFSPTGYVLEVDLDYSSSLHEFHNDLPFAPENIAPPGGKYSKLIPNLNHKTKYVIHYMYLKQCLKYGLQLKKIHRVLKFSQSAWLKPYIDLNTRLRNAATNAFDRDLYKLKNNCIFGKTMENIEKRVSIKLLTEFSKNKQKNGAENYISKPSFKDFRIFDVDLVAIQLRRTSIYYNKPIYVGFSVLDISKDIIYDFFYGFLKNHYKDNVHLLYTDTDSILAHIFTENFYSDMKNNLSMFDTSNFPENNIHDIPKGESIIGRMKDEFGGCIIESFYGTGAKAYCVKTVDDEIKRAKGIKKSAIAKQLNIEHYQAVVEQQQSKVFCNMYIFRSYLHQVFTNYVQKVALSHFDDKRFLIPASSKTLAWGHKDIFHYNTEEASSSEVTSQNPHLSLDVSIKDVGTKSKKRLLF